MGGSNMAKEQGLGRVDLVTFAALEFPLKEKLGQTLILQLTLHIKK